MSMEIREGDVLTGKVTNFGKGYGFIKVANIEPEFFVYFTDIKADGFRTLSKGSTVEFTVAFGDNDKLKAVDVVCTATPSSGRVKDTSNNNCYICNKPGHFARHCPNKPAAGEVVVVECFNCHNHGHISRNCPEKLGGGGGVRRREERACNNCGRVGHLARDCRPASSSSGGGGVRRVEDRECRYCHEVGHLARDCGARFAGKDCYECGGIGHIARDCPSGDGRSRGGGRARVIKGCFNCGKHGHIANDCNAPSRAAAA